MTHTRDVDVHDREGTHRDICDTWGMTHEEDAVCDTWGMTHKEDEVHDTWGGDHASITSTLNESKWKMWIIVVRTAKAPTDSTIVAKSNT